MFITVPLHVVDLGTAAFSFSDLQARLNVVNDIFSYQGIKFTCDSAHDFIKGAGIDLISQKAQSEYMRNKPGRLLVMLFDDGFGGSTSRYAANIGKSPDDVLYKGGRGMAHELGHFLCLYHTFRPQVTEGPPQTDWITIEQLVNDWATGDPKHLLEPFGVQGFLEKALDGDHEDLGAVFPVEDTPPSIHEYHTVKPELFTEEGYVLHGSTVVAGTTLTWDLVFDQHNIMGYFFPNKDLPQCLSTGQGAVARSSLLNGRHFHVTRPMDASDPGRWLTPTLVSWGVGRLDLFATNWDGRVGHKFWQNNAWTPSRTGFIDIGGMVVGQPAAVAWGPNHIDLVARFSDGSIRNKTYESGSWWPNLTGWQSIGGDGSGPPTCISWGPGRLDVFARAKNGACQWNAWTKETQKWSGWTDLGGNLAERPVAVTWGANHIDLVARFSDGTIRNKTYENGSWWPSVTGWKNIGGTGTLAPSVTSWGPGRLDVAAVMSDGKVMHKFWEKNSWLPGQETWNAVSASSAPVADGHVVLLAPEKNRLELFVIGRYDEYLYRSNWTPAGNWSAWTNRGGVLYGSPAACSWGAGHIDLAGRYADGRIHNIAFDYTEKSGQWFLIDEPAYGRPKPGAEYIDLTRRYADDRTHNIVLDYTEKSGQRS